MDFRERSRQFVSKRTVSFRRTVEDTPRAVLFVITLGILLRLGAWGILPPVWKTHAIFNPIHMPVLEYVSNFEGYKPSRMPFFDVFSAVFYVPFGWIMGYKALTLFTLVISSLTLPFFYAAVRRLFDETVALPSLILFAFYPKLLFMTGRGMPEAAAVGFIAISLYGLARALETEEIRWYMLAGTGALLSYLMFVSAVLYGVIVAVFLYACQFHTAESRFALLPRAPFVAFSLPPTIVGIAYLVFGPVQTMVRTGGINKVPLFADPGAYSFAEKVVRYLSYTYFDFWWHTRGFDKEVVLLPTIQSLLDFFGSLSIIYFLGWIAITAAISLTILYGLATLLRERTPIGVFVASLVLVFVVVYNYRNAGWAGAFQTRHVFPIFPAICICLGVGVSRLSPFADSVRLQKIRPLESVDRAKVANVVLVVLLGILVVNGSVQAFILAEKVSEGREKPVAAMNEIVGGDETVGVIRNRAYHDTLIYTNGRIRPTILYEGHSSERGKFTTKLATYQEVNSSDLGSFDVDYVYFKVEVEYLDRLEYQIDVDESFIERITNEGVIVYHQEIDAGAFRTTDTEIFLVRLDGE